MASINKAILIGHLGKDPETRYMPNGDAICNLTLATSPILIRPMMDSGMPTSTSSPSPELSMATGWPAETACCTSTGTSARVPPMGALSTQ